MPRKLYAIRDRVAQDLLAMQMYSLITFKSDQQAVRYFADAILDQTSVLNKHPGDYELILCGEVEDDGTIAALLKPDIIMTGDALIAAQPNRKED